MNKGLFIAILCVVTTGVTPFAAAAQKNATTNNAEARAISLLEHADNAELTDQMLFEAADLLDHDDVFIRAMAEWTLSRKVGYDNRKDMAVWPKENAPA